MLTFANLLGLSDVGTDDQSDVHPWLIIVVSMTQAFSTLYYGRHTNLPTLLFIMHQKFLRMRFVLSKVHRGKVLTHAYSYRIKSVPAPQPVASAFYFFLRVPSRFMGTLYPWMVDFKDSQLLLRALQSTDVLIRSRGILHLSNYTHFWYSRVCQHQNKNTREFSTAGYVLNFGPLKCKL